MSKSTPSSAVHLTVKCFAETASCRSPRYGQHLDIDRIAQIVQAPESEIETITSWLDLNNIPYTVSKTRHVVEAEATVAAVEALLNCELFLFKNKEEPLRTTVRKMGRMYLPNEVARVVRAVFNVVGKYSRDIFCFFCFIMPSSCRPTIVSKGPSSPQTAFRPRAACKSS